MRIKYYHYLLSALLLAFIIYIVNSNVPSNQEILCNNLKKKINLNTTGIISDKYYDNKNHGLPMVHVRTYHGEQVFDLTYDQSGLFEFIKEGDSIEKKYGSLEVKIWRGQVQYLFKIDHNVDCE